MWLINKGCLFLRGTWSYLRICRRSVLPYTRNCNCLLDYDCVLHIVNFASVYIKLNDIRFFKIIVNHLEKLTSYLKWYRNTRRSPVSMLTERSRQPVYRSPSVCCRCPLRFVSVKPVRCNPWVSIGQGQLLISFSRRTFIKIKRKHCRIQCTYTYWYHGVAVSEVSQIVPMLIQQPGNSDFWNLINERLMICCSANQIRFSIAYKKSQIMFEGIVLCCSSQCLL
jgi:hypothetical protein